MAAGTYVGLRVNPFSEGLIKEYIALNGIPQVPTEVEKRRHITLMYSKDTDFLDAFVPRKMSYLVYGDKFDIFPGGAYNKFAKCLVLRLHAPDVNARHEEIKAKHNCTHSYPDFHAHITFSYDVQDMDISKLPKFDSPIIVGEEYADRLNEQWLKDHT